MNVHNLFGLCVVSFSDYLGIKIELEPSFNGAYIIINIDINVGFKINPHS